MRFLLLIAILFFSSCSQATSYSIEDKGFEPAIPAVAKKIEKSKSYKPFYNSECKLQQEKIALGKKNEESALFVTTVEQCGWGAALGPIWIISNQDENHELLFYTGGYSIDVLPESSNGMQDIEVNSEVAGKSIRKKYQFLNKKYQLK